MKAGKTISGRTKRKNKTENEIGAAGYLGIKLAYVYMYIIMHIPHFLPADAE